MKISVVIPVCNEADNVGPLALEIQAALAASGPFEIIFIDDGSTDATAATVVSTRSRVPEIRLLRHSRQCGQSSAVHTGVREARAEWIVTLDGDGQNDPADIPALLSALSASDQQAPGKPPGKVRLVMGHRTTRKDTWLRRISSRVANGVRGRMLNDGTPDTGCGIKLFHRGTFLDLPRFDHMHRFLPALFQRAGSKVVSVPVHHRPRTRGVSKYGLRNRLFVGITDLFGVMWLIRRKPAQVDVTEQ